MENDGSVLLHCGSQHQKTKLLLSAMPTLLLVLLLLLSPFASPLTQEVRDKVQLFLNAACSGNLDLFKKLAAQLDEGANDLTKKVEAVKDANQQGALHFSAREGQTKICKYLLEQLNLHIDSIDEDGETALIHAAHQGHTHTAKYLIDRGSNPTIPSNFGATALHHAAGIGDTELLNYLLSRGVNPDLESDAGTPLVWAAGHAQQTALSVLLQHGANPNAETDDGITPVLSSVAAGLLTCLVLLIKHCIFSAREGHIEIDPIEDEVRQHLFMLLVSDTLILLSFLLTMMVIIVYHKILGAAMTLHDVGKCANRLLMTSGLPSIAKQMKRLELSSIWALLAAFEDPLPLPGGTEFPFEGAFVRGVDSVSWMTNNTKKLLGSQSGGPHCWTFFSTAAYGRQNKVPQENIPSATAARVTAGMLEGVEAALGLSEGSLPKPFYSRLQLWGAALPTNTPRIPCIFDPYGRAGICGDWLLGSNIEAAVLSGIALADHIAEYFQSPGAEGGEFAVGLNHEFQPLEGHDIGQFPGLGSEEKMNEAQIYEHAN